MAEFCLQCAQEHFGKEVGSDFYGIAPPGYLATVLCEGCGPIQVNHLGACVSTDCIHQHGLYRNLEHGEFILPGDEYARGLAPGEPLTDKSVVEWVTFTKKNIDTFEKATGKRLAYNQGDLITRRKLVKDPSASDFLRDKMECYKLAQQNKFTDAALKSPGREYPGGFNILEITRGIIRISQQQMTSDKTEEAVSKAVLEACATYLATSIGMMQLRGLSVRETLIDLIAQSLSFENHESNGD